MRSRSSAKPLSKWPRPGKIPERTPEQARAILGHVFDAAQGKAAADAREVATALDRLHQLHLRYATYSANPGRPLRFLNNVLADRFPDKAITEAEVVAAFSRETGLPLVLLDDEVQLDLGQTRDWFTRRVIGQAEAVDRVLDLLAMVKARLARPRKPLASFLFIGPTGTGKTEMAKSLAEFLFGDPARMVRFDLNEFSDPLSVQRLLQRVQKTIHQAPDTVRYQMNSFVIAVGSYVQPLTDSAIQTAEKIGPVMADLGNNSCQVPFAPDYIRKVQKRGTIGKKRKTGKC